MTDIKKQNKICSHLGCYQEVFENEKCIFHCEKNDWYDENNNGEKNWSKSNHKVRVFWKDIRNKKIKNRDYYFKDYIFPIFENMSLLYYNDYDIMESSKNNRDVKIAKLRFDYGSIGQSFWKEDDELIFYKKADFGSAIFKDKAYFGYMIFLEGVDFSNVVFEDVADFSHSFFFLYIDFRSTEFTSLHFDYSTFFSELVLSNVKLNTVTFFGSILHGVTKINTIKTNDILFITFIGTEINSELSIINIDCETKSSIIFQGAVFHENSDTYLNNIKIQNLFMINLINDSNYFTFSDIQILNEFIIEESNISNLELHNFNASGCDRIRIKNVAFQSNNGFTIFNGVNWGDIRETFDKTTDRDTYRQLKYVNEKQGNIIEANKFYSAEMNAYRKELKDTKWSKRIQDKIIFNLNRCVSNFSQNWVLPFFWFFFNGVVAFVLINYRRIVPYFFSGLELNSNIFWKTVYEYFCFVNPFNNIPNAKNPLVWFIFKVLSVFIIYQFIVSLRRQTRR